MKIRKVKIEEKVKTKSFKVPIEVKASMDSLDDWLKSKSEYEGTLEWDSSIIKEIEKEIENRNNQPEISLSTIKLNLPLSMIEMMRECDKAYIKKGYSVEWNKTIKEILNRLIKAKTRQLSKLFKESPPYAKLDMKSASDGHDTKSKKDVNSLQKEQDSPAYESQIEMRSIR